MKNGSWLISSVRTGPNVDQFLVETMKGAMYYLYSNLPSYTSTEVSVSDFFGLAPGGLANGKPGQDYYGHVFWDMVRLI